MTRNRILALAFLTSLLPAQVFGQTAQTHLGKTLPQRGPAHTDEHIVMPQFPNGWVQQPTQTGAIEVVDYYPTGQTDTTWTDRITLEVHHRSNTLPIDVFQRRALSLMRENCVGVVEAPLQTGVNNGFPSAFWILACKKNKEGNYGEVSYTKAVQGYGTLYLLSRSWRTQPFANGAPPVPKSQIDAAVNFLTTSVVCAESAQHPCPTTKSARK